MNLSEELKYRLAYLTMRIIFDRKLSSADNLAKYPAILQFLDVLAGTTLASEASGKKFPSQRDKLDMFLESEFDDDMMALVNKVVDELI